MAARLRPLRLLLAMIALVAAVPVPAVAQGVGALEEKVLDDRDEPVTITADVLEYESQREVYVARGNVVIVQGDRTLKADWVAFNPDTGAGVASGNVELVDGDDTLRADFVEFNTENLQGVMQGGSLDSPGDQFRTSGREIEKTGENTYIIREGVFTTCRCPKDGETDPWQIRAEEAEIEIDGYGTVKNATFDVLGVPILWMPWMIYPIKTERQTGLLFPSFSIASRNGFGLALPFFWAAADSVNMTITPEWTTKRGFKGDTNVEYVFGDESWGDATGAYAQDEEIDANSIDEPFDRERFAFGGEHHWYLPWDLNAMSSYAFASDNQVPLDFDELSAVRADRFLQSTAGIARDFGGAGRFGGSVSAHFADDLQNPDDVDRDDFLLQRLPQVELAALPGAVPGIPLLRPSLDVDYIWFDYIDKVKGGAGGFADTGIDGLFSAEESSRIGVPTADIHMDDFAVTNPAGTEGDGIFQEGEPLTDSGHRLTLQPRVAVPFRLGRFAEVYPEASWYQTFYDSHQQGGEQRGIFTGRVDLRTRLSRTFGDEIVHVIEPHVGWVYVGGESQTGNPLFTPGTALAQERLRTLDLDAVSRDPSDRLDRAQQLSFGATQRVLGGVGDDGRRWLRADLTLLGLYDFEEHDFADVVLDGRLAPSEFGRLRFNVGFDTDDVRVDEGLAEWSWTHQAGHALTASYRYLRQVPDVFERFPRTDRFDDARPEDGVEQLGGSVRLAVTRQISASWRVAYSFETDRLLGNQGMVEYLSSCGCWAAGIEVADDRARGFQMKVLYRLIGLGKDASPNPGGLLDW